MRLPLEILDIMRQTAPTEVSIWLRISATDWWPEGEEKDGEYISWGIEQSKEFVKEAIKRGVDVVDVSSGGNTPRQDIKIKPGYQVDFAAQIRESLSEEERIPISSVGLITDGVQAEEILDKKQADIVRRFSPPLPRFLANPSCADLLRPRVPPRPLACPQLGAGARCRRQCARRVPARFHPHVHQA